MIEQGIIREINKDIMKIEVRKTKACVNCGLCSPDPDKVNYLYYPCEEDLHVGDLVEINIPELVILKSSAIVFFIPTVGIFLGVITAILVQRIISLDLNLLLISSILFFLIISIFIIRFFDKRSNIEKAISIHRLGK